MDQIKKAEEDNNDNDIFNLNIDLCKFLFKEQRYQEAENKLNSMLIEEKEVKKNLDIYLQLNNVYLK